MIMKGTRMCNRCYYPLVTKIDAGKYIKGSDNAKGTDQESTEEVQTIEAVKRKI